MLMKAIERKLQHLGGFHPALYPPGTESGPLSESETQELENAIGATLPADYREFLLKYGRSRFDGLVRTPECGFYCINYFYGKRSGGDGKGDIKRAISIYEGRMPRSFIPIAYCDDA